MKKLKALKGALIGVFVVAAACCVFAACVSSSDDDSKNDGGGNDTSVSVPTETTSMTLSTDGVKRTYLTYQSFTADGLTAEISYDNGSGDSTEETIAESDLTIDSSEFDNSNAGEYDIIVSYTGDGMNLSEKYTVEVIEEIVGMKVEKTEIDYKAGDTISLDDVSVYSVDANGEAETPMDGGEYEFKYYKNGTEIDSLENLGIGIYTIYAYRQVDIVGKYSTVDYECGAYVLCYVADTLQSIALNEGAVTTQDLNTKDVMTPTWTFTLTYYDSNDSSEDYRTVQIGIDDVTVTGIETKTATEENGCRTATVTYTETCVSSTARDTVTKTISVNYTVVAGEGQVSSDYTYSYSELQTAANLTESSGDTALDNSWFTENNAFLTFVGESSSDKIRPSTSVSSEKGIIEIADAALAVTFKGFGSITVEFCSTNASNTSEIGLQKEDGYFLRGSIENGDSTTISETVLVEGNGYCYAATGNAKGSTVTFDVEEAGTYIITGNISGEYNRATRVKSISMTDIYYQTNDENGETDYDADPVTILATVKPVSPLGGVLCLDGVEIALIGSATEIAGGVDGNRKATN